MPQADRVTASFFAPFALLRRDHFSLLPPCEQSCNVLQQQRRIGKGVAKRRYGGNGTRSVVGSIRQVQHPELALALHSRVFCWFYKLSNAQLHDAPVQL